MQQAIQYVNSFSLFARHTMTSLFKTEPPVMSGDVMKTATQHRLTFELWGNLEMVSHSVNQALRAIDPAQYHALKELKKRSMERYPHVKAAAAVDPLLQEGRAIVYNRRSGSHKDTKDPPKAWAFMLVVGEYEGGELILERLGKKIRYAPGDLIAIRGRVLEHEVAAWSGKCRISMVHFTHQALWTQLGMVVP
jgi:hypothetical protein